MEETVWVQKPISDEAESLAKILNFPPVIGQILINRRVSDPEEASRFLFGTLEDLHDPFRMHGMREAVARIKRAVATGEKILIFGDYDVDGILSVVALSRALESIGGEASYYIPDRLKQGYGIKRKYLDLAVQRGAGLVISVDCGVKAVEFVAEAKKKDIDVIITDHHQPGPSLPEALSILNPAIPESRYPYKNLAGIGVVYKLIQGLFDDPSRASLLPHYLKLVSIGTVADVAELKDENRLFVKFGLKGLEDVRNTGLRCLLDVCGLRGRKVSVGDVGFRLGPRINAAGRLGESDLAVRLFFSSSQEEAEGIARSLDKMNSKRQQLEDLVLAQAMDRIKSRNLALKYKILVLGCEAWHKGVIGIVAARIKDAFYSPVILFSLKEGKAYGSGRSIREFSLIECLDAHRELFLNYGGHTMAVGCELQQQDLVRLKEALNAYAETRLTGDHLKRKIRVDAALDFTEINPRLIECLDLLSPFGMGNPRPLFLTENAELISQPQTIQGKHVKLWLRKNGRILEAVGWNRREWADEVQKGDGIDIVYGVQVSEFSGEERVTLTLEDIRKV